MKKFLLSLIILISSGAWAQTPPNLKNVWGNIDYDDAPWVVNMSRPNKFEKGLEGRHISLWASHGRYFDIDKNVWKWQRPNLFCTTEDLFTQTIVIPYLIPMLENAGCYVFTPRERSWQKNEIIVDNDGIWPKGMIIKEMRTSLEETTGFKMHSGSYVDGENPFNAGTALVMKTAKEKNASRISYVPQIKEAGEYAVYVSYPKLEDAVEDVTYIVRHKGIATHLSVNQTMGYGTWVYIGTFEFDEGENELNCVTILNTSKKKGHIASDAVRFGGGMGNIKRGDSVSGMPRFLEGARYYGQWAGAPYEVYSSKNGENDYGDDINVRSLMTNWIGGASCFMPSHEGLGVPIELSVAIHSDAGFNPDGRSVHGTLSIATTDFNEGVLSAGITRQTSLDLAAQLRDNLCTDMEHEFGKWGKRYLWDRNYSETRLPGVPSAIIETLSHQSFPDMMIGQHPVGKYYIARSLYKTIARYINNQHNRKCVIQPLAPKDFRVEMMGGNKVRLSWTGVTEKSEPTSKPESYNIYTAVGSHGFDNGQNVEATSVSMRLEPDRLYHFRITACNDGGESFPTDVLTAYISSKEKARILIINGFERLSAPYIVNDSIAMGFDLLHDEGVQRGAYPGWSGYQRVFTKSTMGLEDETGMGYSGTELQGKTIAGNDFNYVTEHAEAIVSSGLYSVVGASLSAFDDGLLKINDYNVIDIAFGLQKDDGQLNLHYKTFTTTVQRQLIDFARKGKAIFVSGAFIGSDNRGYDDAAFIENILKCQYKGGSTAKDNVVRGLGMEYTFYKTLNERHYAATHPESLSPTTDAICAMQYSDGTSAGIGYKGEYSVFAMGFPFECITDKVTRNRIMQGIIAYLLK